MGKTIAHTDYAKLRDWILFEEFGDEVLGRAKGEEVTGWP